VEENFFKNFPPPQKLDAHLRILIYYPREIIERCLLILEERNSLPYARIDLQQPELY